MLFRSQADSAYLYNFVDSKEFQFRNKYTYDDYENSAYGIISQIDTSNVMCDGVSDPTKNYININFNDDLLANGQTLCILKYVTVCAREGNDGNWREVIRLKPCEFLDYDGTNWVSSFNFYNDIASTSVADSDVTKPYDDVPLSAEEGLVVKNRGILANVVKGYDAPDCVDAKFEIDFADRPNKETYSINGIIRIVNFFADNQGGYTVRTQSPNILERKSPIIYNKTVDADYPYYGGVTTWGNGNSVFHVYSEANTIYKQILPEGGFTVYLRGTNYFAISKQKSISYAGISQTDIGAIDISTTDQPLKDFYQDGLTNYTNPRFDVYSDFTIENVPNGTYILGVASPQCSFGDKLGKGDMYNLNTGLAYQKTSAPVWGVNVYDAATNTYSWNPQAEITVTVNNGNVFVGEIDIADYVYPNKHGAGLPNSCAIQGYLFDAEGNTSQLELKNDGITVEKTLVTTIPTSGGAGTSFGQQGSLFGTYTNDIHNPSFYCVTDSNGFFFFIGIESFSPNIYYSAYSIRNSAPNLTTQIVDYIGGAPAIVYLSNMKSVLQDLQDQTLQQTWGVVTPMDFRYREVLLPTNKNVRNDCTTYIEGGVVDQNTGNPVSGCLVLYENGKTFKTGQSGQFKILVWGDMSTWYISGTQFNQRVVDSLILMCNPLCDIQYISPNPITVAIAPFSGTYSPTVTYNVGQRIIDETFGGIKYHKRGASYTYGICHTDEAGRYDSVTKAFEIYIPFINEDLYNACVQENYNNPTQYPLGTYKYGQPIITWYLNGTPPNWASTYQWVRTKNTIYGRYLQWIANEITYLSTIATDTIPEKSTAYSNGDAVAIKVSLSNIVNFASQNNGSLVGYEYQSGDRLRIIANRNFDYINNIVDLEISQYDSVTQSLICNIDPAFPEIKSGAYIEIMNPKINLTDQQQIYYEVGEVYKCTAPYSGNNQYSVLTDQFTNGDTYWRGRNIQVFDDGDKYFANYPLIMESSSVSDFFVSEAEDIGRVRISDPNFKQIHYPTMMQHSGIYVEGSALNGLSSFETYNYKELDRAFGGIKRLCYVGNTLLSVHENKVVANYIELRTLSDANQTDGLLAVSDAYFGNDRPLQKEYGTQHYESVIQYNNLVYGIDAAKGVIWRTDENGMNVISDVKIRSFVKDLFRKGVTFAPAVFDPYYREYIVTVNTGRGDRTELVTLAWAEEKNRWSTFYSFTPEMYCSVLRSIVSFKNGQLWLHDKNAVCNNFYGTQYRTELTVIPHTDDTKQTFHTLLLQGAQDKPLTNDWFVDDITNDYGQRSRITKPHFKLKETFWCASFLRDTTDTTVQYPIINGRNLRGQELVLKMVNDSSDGMFLQQIITNIVPSERTPK